MDESRKKLTVIILIIATLGLGVVAVIVGIQIRNSQAPEEVSAAPSGPCTEGETVIGKCGMETCYANQQVYYFCSGNKWLYYCAETSACSTAGGGCSTGGATQCVNGEQQVCDGTSWRDTGECCSGYTRCSDKVCRTSCGGGEGCTAADWTTTCPDGFVPNPVPCSEQVSPWNNDRAAWEAQACADHQITYTCYRCTAPSGGWCESYTSTSACTTDCSQCPASSSQSSSQSAAAAGGQVNCGSSCTSDANCRAAATGAPVGCVSGVCQNLNCIGSTIPGANCSCSTLRACGYSCGPTLGLCQTGSECGFIIDSCLASEGNTAYQFCLPTSPSSPYSRRLCSDGMAAYVLTKNGSSSGLTQSDVFTACTAYYAAGGLPDTGLVDDNVLLIVGGVLIAFGISLSYSRRRQNLALD